MIKIKSFIDTRTGHIYTKHGATNDYSNPLTTSYSLSYLLNHPDFRIKEFVVF